MKSTMRLTAMAALLAGSVAIPAHADDITVTVVNGHPPVFLWVKHLTETFIPTVNEALEGSGHTITWSEAYGGTLAAVGGELEAIEDGLAEVGVVPTVFEPTALPLQNVTYFTPFGTSDPQIVISAIDKLHQDIPGMIESWESYNAEYLGGGFALDNYLMMTNFPVDSIDDLQGRKIGAPGPAVNWLEGTGAVGVAGNLTTYYNDIQTGVFDGAIVFPTAAAPAKLQEVAPHVLITNFGAQYAGSLVANKDWYDAQPEEVQNALRAGAAAYTDAYIAEQNARVEAALKQMEDGGATITELSDEERAKWAAALPQIADVWAKNADGQGLAGSEVLEAYIGQLKDAGVSLARDWSQR
ncbi:C4-dicarboxylate TRAP transporter substrate-binding protein [Mesorhizobium sp. CAU 1741]|uniref:C4-dicarboxylate TRAP transporter substrate-binding protein n=1 Tax=Mesorhizobium sp. CAU 1741 TaxID=3140366 RepID=UPI00325A6213